MDKPKSLRDMLKQNKTNIENMTPDQQRQMKKMHSAYEQYKDRSPEEIAAALENLKGDRDVQRFINSGKLDEFAKSIRPMLGGNAAKLDEILRRIKR